MTSTVQRPPARGGRGAALREAARRVARAPLHPLLFAAYPVLFLFAQNLHQQVTIDPLLAPLALAIGGGALALLALWAVFRRRHVAALVTSIAIALFFGYGHAWNLVGGLMRDERLLLIAWAVLGAAAIWFGVRLRRRAEAATPALNLLAAFLVTINAVPILGYQVGEVWAPDAPAAAAAEASGLSVEGTGGPDIYYIIFDRYADARTLEDEFSFDNTPFLEELERRGFYVARDSTANYLKTALSLVSSLNVEYLDIGALEEQARSPGDWGPIYAALQTSHTVDRFLHERGYRYIHLGPLWDPNRTNPAADQNIQYGGLPEFSVELLETTLVRGVASVVPSDARSPAEDPYFRSQYDHTAFQLDRLRRVAALRSPKFVFAHVLLPHWPYVFDREGNYVPRHEQRRRGDRDGYVAQVEYVNNYVLDLLDILLAGPPEDHPIVLIQADEGPPPPRYTESQRRFDWLQARPDELYMKFRILNTYYLPGVTPEQAGLYPSITPVNSFRVVFNAYFGTDLPLLDDRNWVFVDEAHLYDTREVTDRVAEGLD